jgi:tetratricopeptide (TPR) repeat protein
LTTERIDDCIRLLQPLVDVRPGDLTNRANLGTAYLLSRRFEEAEQQFEVIVGRQPGEAVHLAKLAWAEWELKKSDEALAHLMTAIEIQPEQTTVRYVAAMVLMRDKS